MRRRLLHTLPAETPLVLIGKEGSKRVVTAADRKARQLGIKPGMAASKASAMVANLHLEYSDPDGDAEALEKLGHWAFEHYSPIVMADCDGLLIDATGVAHLFGGEEAMIADLLARLTSAHIEGQAAIAPTYGAAYALARFASKKQPRIIAAGIERYIQSLPIAGLRLPLETLSALHDLGFETISELLKAPRSSLALRFGSDIGRRLSQALGQLHEPVVPIIPKDVIASEKLLAEPISTPEALAYCIDRLVSELCRMLEDKGMGVRRLDLHFYRVDNRIETIRIGLAKPSRVHKQLTRLLTDKLVKVDPGFGIEKAMLIASWAEPLLSYQATADFAGKVSPDIASLIDTLSNRLGSDHLYQFLPVESDVPERSVKQVEVLENNGNVPQEIRFPRPTRLLPRPEPIQTMALLPDHPPVSFTWKGKRRKIVRAEGPERLFGEWWKRDSEIQAVRDYFQVEDEEGRRFWVYRAGDGETAESGNQNWFLHGLFA